MDLTPGPPSSKTLKQDFPGGPVVKTPCFPVLLHHGAQVQSPVREIRSNMPHGKKKKKIQQKIPQTISLPCNDANVNISDRNVHNDKNALIREPAVSQHCLTVWQARPCVISPPLHGGKSRLSICPRSPYSRDVAWTQAVLPPKSILELLTYTNFWKWRNWDFPGSPVVKTSHFQCKGQDSTPGQGTRSHMPQLTVHMLKLKIPRAYMCAKSLQSCLTPYDPMDCSPRGSTLYGFSRQGYWNELPCCPPGDLPNPGMETASLNSPALAGGFFTTSTTIPQQRYRMLQLRPSTAK